MITVRSVWEDVEKIRKASPLINNITNLVVMNNTANALLALGASPVMVDSEEEIEQMVGISSALVVNIGTLGTSCVNAMKKGMKKAREKGIPIVLDPVGVGATPYRSQIIQELFSAAVPTIIRGNASEISAVISPDVKTKGVDSTMESAAASTAGRALSSRHNCVVSISGEEDYIIQGNEVEIIRNGHSMMPRVTGLGCTATAISAAFAAVNSSAFAAAAHAMAVMGIAGEIAARKAAGPGSLQMHFLDALFNLTETDIGLLKTGKA